MFDQFLRALKDRLFTPLSRAIGPSVSPTTLSVLALAAGLGAAAAALARRDGVALALWVVNRFLDGLDGTHARVHGRSADFGGYLDIVFDFLVYAAVPLAIAVADGTRDLALTCAVLMGAFFVNAASWMYLSAILERRDAGAATRGELTTVTMPPGLVAGAETVVFYALFLVFPGARRGLFLTMAALVSVNVVQRLWWARRALQAVPRNQTPSAGLSAPHP